MHCFKLFQSIITETQEVGQKNIDSLKNLCFNIINLVSVHKYQINFSDVDGAKRWKLKQQKI